MVCLTYVFCVLAIFYVQNSVGNSPKISCFTGFWSREQTRFGLMTYDLKYVPPEACDFLFYAFVTVNIDNWKIDHRYRVPDIDRGGFNQSVAIKKQNPKLKVILSFGGMPYKDHGHVIHYSKMMEESSRRQIFVESAVKFLRTHGFDGLELHWYYPGAHDGSPSDKDNYLLLVKELHAAFAPNNFTLYATVPFLRTDIDAGFHVAELNKYLDYFHVRTLAMNLDKFEAHNTSPLRRRSFEASEDNVETVLDMYVSLGASKEKLIFGIPFEYYVFKLQDSNSDYLGAPVIGLDDEKGLFSQELHIFYYHEVCARTQSGKWILKRDLASGIPYAVNPATRQWVSYEDERTLTDKVKFVKQEGFGGVFVWLMENDDFRGLCGEKHGHLHTIKREMMKPLILKESSDTAIGEKY